MTAVVDLFDAVDRPFPLEPLWEVAKATSQSELAVRLRTRQSTISRAAVDGFTIDQADRFACAIGRHPANVWPDWYAHVPEEPS